MKLTLIRHATLQIELAGQRLLVDPMLAEPQTYRSLTLGASAQRNPTAPLPCDVESLLQADAALVTHSHFDHFDSAAQARLSKQLPLFCQPADQTRFQARGFERVIPIDHSPFAWDRLQLFRTDGSHGRGLVGRAMGRVSGFVLKAEHEPVVYIAGDTIWCPAVQAALEKYRPDVVVVNAGAAQFNLGTPITMTAQDVVQVCQAAPQAGATACAVIAVHMDAVNHCRVTRRMLAEHVSKAGVGQRVFIPYDGQVIEP